MKNPPKNMHTKEQALINRKIEEMLSELDKRNKLIAEYYKSFLMLDNKVLETDAKEQDKLVSQ